MLLQGHCLRKVKKFHGRSHQKSNGKSNIRHKNKKERDREFLGVYPQKDTDKPKEHSTEQHRKEGIGRRRQGLCRSFSGAALFA